MSRIGKKVILIPAGVNVTINGNDVTVTGPKGTLTKSIRPEVLVKVDGSEINVINNGKTKESNAYHGLFRQIIANMVTGVSAGFTKTLIINGVGYKTAMKGNDVVLNIGFSHPVEIKAVPGITLSCEKNSVTVSGIDKELVGKFASYIRDIKPVEPYHAYGIYYSDEVVKRKETKTGKK